MRTNNPSGRRPRTAVLAVLAILALVAGACGSDGGGSASSPTDPPANGASGTTPADDDGCPAPQPLDEPAEAKIVSTVNIETFAPALLAQHFGEFDKENLEIEMITAPSNEGTVMVASGQAQLKLAGVTAAFFNAVNGGVDSVWVANQHQNSPDSKEGIWLRSDLYGPDGEIDVEQLRGARIAPGTGGVGSISSFQINLFLQEHGLTLADIEIVPIGGSDMLVALENGSIDGGYILTPQWLELEDNDAVRYAGLYGQEDGADRAAMFEMSRSYIDSEPEAAQALIRAIARSICLYLQPGYHDDPEVLAALVEVTGSTPEAIQGSPELLFDQDLPLYDGIITGSQEMWLDHAPGTLNYEEPLPVDQLTYHQLVEDALAG